jgi:hypothetical protein
MDVKRRQQSMNRYSDGYYNDSYYEPEDDEEYDEDGELIDDYEDGEDEDE